jgi:DNA polymerase-3 subunit alpha
MLSIQSSLGTIESIEKNTADLSFLDSKDFIKLFEKHKDAVENIQKIVDKCDVEIKLGAWVFPDYKIESGLSPDDELKRLVYVGVEKKKMILDDYTKERIEYELSVIKQKGYAPYFLVVADLLKFSKENGILSNIRGSVSGSMVTYLSGITKINPIEYQIPFERFLNPERPSAPDIDMDYADDRRDEVVDYARRKYGNDKVAQIGTFGTMMARGAVRDVARALGYPYVIGDRLAKLIPMGQQGFPMTIDRAMEEVPELKEAYNKETDVKKIIDMAKKIEGCARHISIHAAGVVISPTLITDFVPLQYDPKGENKIITQYDMYAVEDAGLLKFDFLGLKNLTIITNTVKLIKKLSGTELDVDEIPIDDKKTFEMLARGETSDLFQLNGDGMTKYLKDLRPTTIHDINAMVALYRPGPIQFIPEYIARKHDRSKIFYLDPSLESILEKTYGILVYQDDLLMMANKLAGYSWGEVDKFRKAVGKKIPEEMAKQKEKFIQGCITYSNWPEAKARELWEWIEPFASYGFNKAHSVSYGRVAYITAYLKANYPGEYMRAVLNSEQGETEKVAESVVECERMGIEVLPPDINESFEEFTLIKPKEDKDKIRFGLTTIKNFGEGIAHIIVEERKANGIFKSLEDFLIRIKDRNLNKKSMEALVKCGAMDSFGERGEILANMEDLLLFNKESAKGLENQNSLFGAETEMPKSHLRLKKSEPAGQTEKLAWEKELLGLYVSGHPMDKYEEKFKKLNTNILKIKSINRDGISVLIGGLIENVRVINTKNGSPMAFVRISDKTSSMEIVAFPKLYEKDSKIFEVGQCIVCKGKLSKRGDDLSIIADQVKKVSE